MRTDPDVWSHVEGVKALQDTRRRSLPAPPLTSSALPGFLASPEEQVRIVILMNLGPSARTDRGRDRVGRSSLV